MNALETVQQNDICALRIICTLSRNDKSAYDIEEVDQYGNTALLKACYLGRFEATVTLLNFGANIKAINYLGQNALTLAAYSGDINLICELLRYRTYEDFNLSSIIPAICVAALCENQNLIAFFKTLQTPQTSHVDTVHGLKADDLISMLSHCANKS